MGSPVNVYGAIAWAIILGFVLFLALLNWLFFRRLRRRHPEVYESLGSPSFKNPSLRRSLRCARFMFSAERRRLSDPTLVVVYFAMQILGCVYGILFLTILVLFFRGAFRPTKEHPRFGSQDQHKTGTLRDPAMRIQFCSSLPTVNWHASLGFWIAKYEGAMPSGFAWAWGRRLNSDDMPTPSRWACHPDSALANVQRPLPITAG
jgi:hypothetical protein